MKHYNSPPSEKRSAVIISQDGEVQECIDIDQAGANEISFSHINDIDIENKVHSHKSGFRFSTWLLASSFILVVAVTAYIYLGTAITPFPGASHFVTNTISNEIQEPIEKLKRKATFIIQDNLSDSNYIDSFINEWNQLTESVKEEFSASFWLERYINLLEEKINFIRGSESSAPDSTNKYIDKLINMTSLIKIEDVANIIESPTIEKDFAEIFKAITTDIAKAETEKKKSGESNGKILNKKTARTNTQGFAESDINYLLGQYATTYEFGRTDRIMDYFSVNSSYKKQLVKSFDKVFSYSARRHIKFSNLTWTFYKNSIVGNGKYNAKLVLKDNKGTRFIDANIQLKMRVKSKQLRISKLKFSTVKVNLVPNGSTPLTKTMATKSKAYKKNQKHKTSKKPTAAELRDVIARFISAYESGNLTALNSIFSKNVKTNDNTNISGIKQDYKSLFSTTTDRRLIIEGLHWSYRDDQAQGIGRLSVLTVSKGSNKLISRFGDIQIAAQKSNNKVIITHLFHNLNKK